MPEPETFGCVVCADQQAQHCQGYISLQIDEGDEVYTDHRFCCWGHARLWVAANEPPFDPAPNEPVTIGTRIAEVGCLLVVLAALAALLIGIGVGVGTIVDWIAG